jgi:hypothetical protein
MQDGQHMRRIDLPSPETIKALSRIVPQCQDELNQVAKAKAKLPRINSRKPIPPTEPTKPVIDGRGRGSKPLVAKSKPFGGALLKYCQAGDKRGYVREYARLWKLHKKQTPQQDVCPKAQYHNRMYAPQSL